MSLFRPVGTVRLLPGSDDLPIAQRTELAVECDAAIGSIRRVEPFYGHGWYHEKVHPLSDDLGLPSPFHVRVERIYSYLGERRGIVGRIREPEFLYDGFWIVSMTRHIGMWNFTDRPPQSNLLICPQQPRQGTIDEAPQHGENWPVWHLVGHPQASGFGRLIQQKE